MQNDTVTVVGTPVAGTAPTHTMPVVPVRHPPSAGFHAPEATGTPATPQIEVAAPANATVKDHDDAATETPVNWNGPEQPAPVAVPAPASWP